MRGKASEIGNATCFVSHAWNNKFLDLCDAIIDHFKEEQGDGDGDADGDNESFVWIDIFSVDQHHHHVHTNTSLQARRTRTSQWALWLFYWCSIRAVMVPKHYCSDSEGGGARVREVGK